MNPRYLPKTPDERIDRVVEEVGEILQPIGKAGRFGFASCHPDGGPNNAAELLTEIADLRHALNEAEADLIKVAAILGPEVDGKRIKFVWTETVLSADDLIGVTGFFGDEDEMDEDFARLKFLSENKSIEVCRGIWIREGMNYRFYNDPEWDDGTA